MKVTLEKSYPMPAPGESAWALLQDIEGVASCMPGARITERVDAKHYKGTVSIKVGPASLSFRGEIEVVALDPTARTLHLFARGTDTTGSSGASMDLSARVENIDAASCELKGSSEVSMSGKAATFGGRVMLPVADQVLNQFAANFAARLQAARAAPSTAASKTPAGVNAEAGVSSRPLSGFALVWAVIKDWIRTLFAANKA